MQAEGLDSFYFFRVDDFWIVDATKVFGLLAMLRHDTLRLCEFLTIGVQKHNQAHCINHSCDPNCYAKILTIDGKKKCDSYYDTFTSFSSHRAELLFMHNIIYKRARS
jgi:hypothetical protein